MCEFFGQFNDIDDLATCIREAERWLCGDIAVCGDEGDALTVAGAAVTFGLRWNWELISHYE